MSLASERSQRYQERQRKAKRCITCAEKNDRWPKQKCTACSKKQAEYYKNRGKSHRLRPSVRLMRYMAKRIKELEAEVRRLRSGTELSYGGTSGWEGIPEKRQSHILRPIGRDGGTAQQEIP